MAGSLVWVGFTLIRGESRNRQFRLANRTSMDVRLNEKLQIVLEAPQLKAFVTKQLLAFNQNILTLSKISHEKPGKFNQLPRVCWCVRNVLFIVQTGYAGFPGKVANRKRGTSEETHSGQTPTQQQACRKF